MKININDKIYIQKKDIELIIKYINEEKTPKSIIEIYKEKTNLNELDFIEFNSKNEIDFLNSFWFIIDYIDFKDFSDLEIIDYRHNDLVTLKEMQFEYDSKHMIDNNKVYSNILDLLLEKFAFYIPNTAEVKNYPLNFQLLYNKLLDFDTINQFKNGHIKLNLPEDVNRPIYYTKRQLQKIYYEVLTNDLSFEELKSIEKQLYSIFSRINYSPEILTIIRKLIKLNEHNTLEFIQDDLLDILLYLIGKKSKFEESSMFLIDHLYSIGYNKFEEFDSKIILEMDLKRIKKTIGFIMSYKPDDYFINGLSKYNYRLAGIINILKKSDFSYKNKNSALINDIFLNMVVFIYFKPGLFNNDFEFMEEIYDYLNDNIEYVIEFVGYNNTHNDFDDNFIKYFNNANKLLIDLYNEKYNITNCKKINSSRKF